MPGLPLALALRMTGRDWRAGELRFLLLSLVVAVAALSAVGFFVDRMRNGLARDATQLLGADLLVRSDQSIPPAWKAEADRLGLRVAETVVFPSMASTARAAIPDAPKPSRSADRADISQSASQPATLLASVKAVTPGYPLRGVVKLSGPGETEVPASGIPDSGTVWVDPSLLAGMGLAPGAQIKLGERSFRVAQVIATEPDRGAAFMNFAPRVMLRMDDLASTKLIQFGSRVTYRLLVSGRPAAVAAYQRWMEEGMARDKLRGVQLESLESGRPEMRATLDRAGQFLSLVGLLSAMLAAVAIAMAARRFMVRHIDACAMLRCLGLTQRQVTLMFLIEFLLVGLVGSALGAAIGYAAHFVLIEWLGRLVTTQLPPASWLPALQGLGTGLVLLAGFALPPILQLRDVPHNRVIRREQDPPQAATLATYALGLISFVGLLLWQAGDLRLGMLTAGGFLGGLAVFALVGWLALRFLRLARPSITNPGLRFAVTALQRRPGASVVQIVSLALGLMALLLLTVIRGDLVSAWRQATPADAPNQFVLNIQPDQKPAVESLLRQGGVKAATLYPMIRGRLTAINGNAVTGNTYTEGRARQLVEREFNLSTMNTPPDANQIVAGRWFDNRGPEASVEQGLAQTLNLKLGDRLRFDIAGQTAEATVTSLRKLDWGSMRVNFFVILNPALVTDLPQTFITAFHLPPQAETLVSNLVRDFPNLTVVDIGNVVRQVQGVIDNVIVAVEFLFLFTLLSGVLVLYAALLGSQEERTREAALLRALGATRSQLSSAQWIEFGMIGGLAGLLAATGAAATGWALAQYVFHFEWSFKPLVWIAGILVGIACALAGGWLGLRQILLRPPLQSLREG
ncbi:MAG: transporter permease [Herminiimonas sp.]|nr:transporter permease [Herminiimonas sp.]MDB5852767.1 transporter permease [Herminiimonas sp.]